MDDIDYTEYDDNDEPIIPDLKEWYQAGVDMGATHMVISWDEEYYPPSYVMPDGDTLERVEHYCESSGHIMGTYDLSVPLTQKQIDRYHGDKNA